MNELTYLVTSGKVVHHPTVASAAEHWGHPGLVHIPIADMAPMRSALVWRRGLRDPTLREFIPGSLSRWSRSSSRSASRRSSSSFAASTTCDAIPLLPLAGSSTAQHPSAYTRMSLTLT